MAKRGNHKKRVRMRKAIQAAKKSQEAIKEIRRVPINRLTLSQLESIVSSFS